MDKIHLEGLTVEQTEAVHSDFKNLFISAGPGSGKTRVLTTRIFEKIILPIINYDAKNSNVIPYAKTFVITFTNKAAKELKDRLNSLIKQHIKTEEEFPLKEKRFRGRLFVGTFHALGFNLIRRNKEMLPFTGKGFTIITDKEAKLILKFVETNLKKDGVDFKGFKPVTFLNILKEHKQSFRIDSDNTLYEDSYLYDEKHFNLILKKKQHVIDPNSSEKTLKETYMKVYREYSLELFNSCQLDFDDLLQWPIFIFQALIKDPESNIDTNGNPLLFVKNLFVDEYQDCNSLQLYLLEILKEYCDRVNSSLEVTVVGDPDQSIFSWRDFKHISIKPNAQLKPKKLFEISTSDQLNKLGWEKTQLSKNFRSTKQIVDVALEVIKVDSSKRFRSNHKVDNKAKEKEKINHPKPILRKFKSDIMEASTIVKEIKDMLSIAKSIEFPLQFKDFAILVRATRIIPPLLKQFIAQGIPYESIGNSALFKRKQILDVLAYLKVLVNPLDRTSIIRVVKFPPKRIGPQVQNTILDLITKDFNFKDLILSLNQPNTDVPKHLIDKYKKVKGNPGMKKMKSQLLKMYSILEQETSPTLDEFIVNILEIIEYGDLENEEVGKEDKEDDILDGSDPFEGTSPLKALISYTKTFIVPFVPDENDNEQGDDTIDKSKPDLTNSIIELLEAASLGDTALDPDCEKEKEKPIDRNTVKVATLHSSKGLEWPVVYIVGAEQGMIPHYLSTKDNREDEEARLLYVGITRCEFLLNITHCKSRNSSNSFYPDYSELEISSFLEGVPKAFFSNKSIELSNEFWMEFSTFLNRPFDAQKLNVNSVKVNKAKKIMARPDTNGSNDNTSKADIIDLSEEKEVEYTTSFPGFVSSLTLYRPNDKKATNLTKNNSNSKKSKTENKRPKDHLSANLTGVISSDNDDVIDLTKPDVKKKLTKKYKANVE